LIVHVRNNSRISDYERQTGIKILDIVIENAPVLFDGIDEQDSQPLLETNAPEITIELIKQIALWDKNTQESYPNE
jgi:hypothetical protein